MLTDTICRFLDDNLGHDSSSLSAQLTVAFSGGGDSTALLKASIDWCRLHGRSKVLALIVDHNLRAESANEARIAAQRARAMGAITKVLKWARPNHQTVQEHARDARYQLMGDVCRQGGIDTLLLGHTRNDQAETVMMRLESGSGWRGLAGIAARIHAPVWPALNGIEVMRPMLGLGREEIRAFNRAQGLECFDDPSNDNPAYTRVSIRQYLAANSDFPHKLTEIGACATAHIRAENRGVSEYVQTHVQISPFGVAQMTVVDDTDICIQALRRVIQCVSGQSLMPPTDKTQSLARHCLQPRFRGATLGGAMIMPGDGKILIGRDPGAVLGRDGHNGLGTIAGNPGQDIVWDGRFQIRINAKIELSPLGRIDPSLLPPDMLDLSLPNPVRDTLPMVKFKETWYNPWQALKDKHPFVLDIQACAHSRLSGIIRH